MPEPCMLAGPVTGAKSELLSINSEDLRTMGSDEQLGMFLNVLADAPSMPGRADSAMSWGWDAPVAEAEVVEERGEPGEGIAL